MKTTLSIIIVSFNTKSYLKQCLDSLFSHYKKELNSKTYEIIVVDNNSTDGSQQMVQKHFPKVLLIQQRENTGFAAANNKGINKSIGSYILLLNPDTIVGPTVLAHMLSVVETDSTVGIATCRVVLSDGSLDDACHRGFPTPWRAFCHFSGLSNLFPSSMLFNGYHLGYQNLNTTHEIDACAGAFMMIRRTAGKKVSFLDEDYFWYGEDLDFCFKVKQAGWKVIFVPTVRITHYKGVASGIKKHSKNISSADKETRLKATKARFAVMRIFYQKHYKNTYPRIITTLVLFAIAIKYEISKRRI